MIYAYYEKRRYCRQCRGKTVQYRHHPRFPKSWRMIYLWPRAFYLAMIDPWRCRQCAHFWRW